MIARDLKYILLVFQTIHSVEDRHWWLRMPDPEYIYRNGQKRFILGKTLDRGAFGEVRLAINVDTKEQVAVKLEVKDDNPELTLPLEWGFYKKLGEAKGVPKTYLFAPFFDKNKVEKIAMVIELLGPSLEKKFEQCENYFSLSIWGQIAMQLIDRIEYVHSKGMLNLFQLLVANNCLQQV